MNAQRTYPCPFDDCDRVFIEVPQLNDHVERHRAAIAPAAARPCRTPGDFHGTVGGYNNHRCRCDECRRAKREYQREYQRRIRELARRAIEAGLDDA